MRVVPIWKPVTRTCPKQSFFKKNLCYYCKSQGHKLSECNKRKQKAREARVNHATLDEQEDDYEYGFCKEDESDLNIFEHAIIGGNQVNVLIDSGADRNIIRPMLGKKLPQRTTVRATRFDDTVSMKTNTNVYKEDIVVEGETYKNVVLKEENFQSNKMSFLVIHGSCNQSKY
ncbi:hypothetical protein PsorP6_019376 [Peronosclerospora sorghi]|nr:hypothetical protein PsorP6_019438 [Peronosclerospora sorghi]KAI9895486.1 hypothetical protein PsorP6_019376 [Peronosclerospora sorghi]